MVATTASHERVAIKGTQCAHQSVTTRYNARLAVVALRYHFGAFCATPWATPAERSDYSLIDERDERPEPNRKARTVRQRVIDCLVSGVFPYC